MANNTPPAKMYPVLTVDQIQNPSKLYAFPILGFIIKCFMFIPILFVLIFYGIGIGVLVLINSFYVLATGKYWDTAYRWLSGYLAYSVKIGFFFYGLTDTYPGFGFEVTDSWKLQVQKPEHPNRFFAIPLLGFLIRIILLIPYLIFNQVVAYASYLAAVLASFSVLARGQYLEGSYELVRDYTRVNLAANCYLLGLSDSYPTFWISMNHKTMKIILLVLAVLLMIVNQVNSFSSRRQYNYENKSMYPNMQNQNDYMPNKTQSDLPTYN